MRNHWAVAAINPVYQTHLLRYHNVVHTPVGDVFTVPGYREHNYLVEINKIFSTNPGFGLVYRNGTITHPVKYHTPKAIVPPAKSLSLEAAAESMVKQIAAGNDKINLLWSGGIDSTFMVNAFLQHCDDRSQLRILYSPWSTYEHPEYLTFVKTNFANIELIDLSGEVYMRTTAWDGCYVSGDGGDESHASIDESFFNQHGYETLHKPWFDFFVNYCNDSDFLEFCQWFFAQSGREIHSVLEARWWFYLSCKYYGQLFQGKWPFWVGTFDNFDPGRLISFFDSSDYLSFIYHNVSAILPDRHYASWRQFLKDYCLKFDHCHNWWATHKKLNSTQLFDYSYKKQALLDRRWLMFLSDGTRIATPSLPFFSDKEFDQHHGRGLQELFNVQPS